MDRFAALTCTDPEWAKQMRPVILLFSFNTFFTHSIPAANMAAVPNIGRMTLIDIYCDALK